MVYGYGVVDCAFEWRPIPIMLKDVNIEGHFLSSDDFLRSLTARANPTMHRHFSGLFRPATYSLLLTKGIL